MKNYAVICEYNPFHKGHEYLLSSVKKEGDTVTAIMSGELTERGELAVLSKYERAAAALSGGADLVLELPFPYSSSGSENFAFGGVDIVSRLGFIDALAFGAECGSADALYLAAKRTLSDEFLTAVSENTAAGAGKNYADIYFDTYRALYGDDGVFAGSNNILAVAYLSQIISRGDTLGFTAVKRAGQSYSGEGEGLASATSIRKMIYSGEDLSAVLPTYSYEILKNAVENGKISHPERIFPAVSAFLLSSSAEELSEYAENDFSLSCRLINAAKNAHTLDMLLSLAVTKKYSLSRVRRALLFAFFGVKKEKSAPVPYTLVLAANEKGRALLSRARRSASIPIITKPADYVKLDGRGREAFELSLRAAALRGATLEAAESCADILRKKPYML